MYQSPVKLSNKYFFSENKYLSNCIPISQVIIPLRDAVFKFIISELYTTDVQVLMCVYLENNKVAESYEDRQNTINCLNIYNSVFAF